MTYQILIALRGEHFLTADLKTSSREEAERRFNLTSAQFDPIKGWTVELLEWTTPVGRSLATQEPTE